MLVAMIKEDGLNKKREGRQRRGEQRCMRTLHMAGHAMSAQVSMLLMQKASIGLHVCMTSLYIRDPAACDCVYDCVGHVLVAV